MIMFGIYLDADSRFKLLSRSSERKTLRNVAFLGLGVAQALVLATVVMAGLGLNPEHTFLFFMSCMLISMTFISIVQFCLVVCKDIGKLLAILLLILQLTSCAGTFPLETIPKFFQSLYPFMPMTYAINLFKEAISSGSAAHALPNILVLLVILAVVTGATILYTTLSGRRRKIKTGKEPVPT